MLESTRSSAPRCLSTLAALAIGAGCLLATAEASAAGIIKNPGDHPDYSVELEPHVLLAWDNYWWGGTGFGLGMHAKIPFFHNGPIDKINNNMGIGFGLDWAHYSDNGCGWWYNGRFGPGYPGCNVTANALLFPVYMEWNFFLTKVVSVFGEPGFGIAYWWADLSPYGGCPIGVDCTVSHTGPFPYFEAGARFLFGDTAGMEVKIGYPYLTVGASILL